MNKLNKEVIISEDEWIMYLHNNISYQGYVLHKDGLISYVLPEINITSNVVMEMGYKSHYNIETQLEYNIYDASHDYEYLSYLLTEDKLKISLGLTGRQLEIWGKNTISTRGKFSGATKGTSPASMFFRYNTSLGKIKIPPKIVKKIPPKIGNTPIRTSNLGGLAGRMTPVVGRACFVVGAATSVYSIYESDNKPKAITREIGGWAGMWAGAKIGAIGGATLGSFVPVIGTTAVGVTGGIIGGITGYFVGSNLTEFGYETIIE